MCLICPLFWLLFFGHRLILYRTSYGRCAALVGAYASFDSYVEASLTAMGTPIVMVILACLLYRSVHSMSQRRVLASSSETPVIVMQRTTFRKLETKLTLMLLTQVVIAAVTCIPYASEVIYSNVTVNWAKSSLWRAIESVVIETIRLLSYLFFTTSFYISLITNRGFRHRFKRVFVAGPPSISTTQ